MLEDACQRLGLNRENASTAVTTHNFASTCFGSIITPNQLDEVAMELSRRLSAAHSRIVQLLQRPGVAARPAVHSAWGDVDAGHFGAYQADHSHGHTSELSVAFPPTA